MIIVMKARATDNEIGAIVNKIENLGLKAHISKGVERTIIGAIGDERQIKQEQFEILPGVESVIPILKPYKLVSREFKPENSIIKVNNEVKIGGKEIVIMAGPCAVESEEQLITTALKVKEAGAKILRGGAFKPRTDPYSFQGLGEDGLKILAKARDITGLAIVTEVMDTTEVELVAEYSDILQIGARNMQNFRLLKKVGQTKKPVLLKRGLSANLKEFLMSAEYILSEGNYNVILCERGIRTYVEYSRNTLDLNIIPVVKKLSHLPIIVDPSHGTGRYDLVEPMSKAAIAAGADGLMIEVHINPAEAVSDADQTLKTERFFELMNNLKPIIYAMGREI
ncbi:MAG TPA: 3-deoxy-7-phosphoheptulonate synthase [Bacteroidota bacterium]|jgi:3-deoxy-7-phosphoheptulonate synthase|nr:3-deoxy-7-phosphoheptulonate synthase [Bacteroidota bacterium]